MNAVTPTTLNASPAIANPWSLHAMAIPDFNWKAWKGWPRNGHRVNRGWPRRGDLPHKPPLSLLAK